MSVVHRWKNIFRPSSRSGWSNSDAEFFPSKKDVAYIKELLERILTQNILPFWYPRVIDAVNGGYRLNYDVSGRWTGESDKFIVTQSRALWFFSRLSYTAYGKTDYLEAAHHGFNFLGQHMWDKEHGGFYWAVDSSGDVPTMPDKHSYAQAFGLYALTEYALASGDSSARSMAQTLFSLLEGHAHDDEHGGYKECLLKNWDPAPEDSTGLLGAPPAHKLMNTHLHLTEALSMYYTLTRDPVAHKRLLELIIIMSSTIVHESVGACTNAFQTDWTRLSGPGYDRISYGHNIESVWMMLNACNKAGVSPAIILNVCRTLFRYSLSYGFDQKEGGFYSEGPLSARADRREKRCWVQAECLLGAIYMHQLTKERIYWDCFQRTLDWITNHQVDWGHGDWHTIIDTKGMPSGDKAGEWGGPYHNVRAILECLEVIESFSKQTA